MFNDYVLLFMNNFRVYFYFITSDYMDIVLTILIWRFFFLRFDFFDTVPLQCFNIKHVIFRFTWLQRRICKKKKCIIYCTFSRYCILKLTYFNVFSAYKALNPVRDTFQNVYIIFWKIIPHYYGQYGVFLRIRRVALNLTRYSQSRKCRSTFILYVRNGQTTEEE